MEITIRSKEIGLLKKNILILGGILNGDKFIYLYSELEDIG